MTKRRKPRQCWDTMLSEIPHGFRWGMWEIFRAFDSERIGTVIIVRGNRVEYALAMSPRGRSARLIRGTNRPPKRKARKARKAPWVPPFAEPGDPIALEKHAEEKRRVWR